MLNQKDKLERFAAVINRTANEQCRLIEKQTKQLEEKKLREIEIQSKAELEASLNNELKSIREELSREISSVKAESRKKRTAHREMLTEKVFLLAEEKIKAFTLSDAYEEFLSKSFSALCEALGDSFTLFARKEDMELVKKVAEKSAVNVSFCEDKENRLGGLSGISKDGSLRAVDTLESRLEAEKESFKENSKLAINI